ncbi:MAG: lamin tail domain-containing protein, partial [Bacteroidota bacterium]
DYYGGIENRIESNVHRDFKNEYEFSHWESKMGNNIAPSMTNRRAVLNLTQADTLVAVFRPIDTELQKDLVINELMASNETTATDQNDEYEDWIELYNNTDQAIDLTDYSLSDNVQNLGKYTFPEGTTLPAKAYLIVWADEDNDQEGLHANFKLSRSGESVFLVNPNAVIIDEVSYEDLEQDQSFARTPNGTGDFIKKAPTFNQNNDEAGTTNVHQINGQNLLVYPNPVRQQLFLELQNGTENITDIKLFDAVGHLVQEKKLNAKKARLGVQDLNAGFYFVLVNGQFGQKIVISE